MRIAGHEMEWASLKRAKVFSPVIVQAKRGFRNVNDIKTEFNVIDNKNGIGSFLGAVLSQPIATGRLKKTSTLAS